MRGAWIATAWAGIFAVVHLYWAAGGRVGLGDITAANAAFGRGWFVLFNGGVAIGCVIAAALAAATLRSTPPLPRGLLRVGLWMTSTVLLARGGIGVVQMLASQRTVAEEVSPLLVLYDPWFLAGGMVFAAVAWRHSRRDAAGRHQSTPR